MVPDQLILQALVTNYVELVLMLLSPLTSTWLGGLGLAGLAYLLRRNFIFQITLLLVVSTVAGRKLFMMQEKVNETREYVKKKARPQEELAEAVLAGRKTLEQKAVEESENVHAYYSYVDLRPWHSKVKWGNVFTGLFFLSIIAFYLTSTFLRIAYYYYTHNLPYQVRTSRKNMWRLQSNAIREVVAINNDELGLIGKFVYGRRLSSPPKSGLEGFAYPRVLSLINWLKGYKPQEVTTWGSELIEMEEW